MLNTYYQPSEKASRISFIYFFISAFCILPILSWSYVYATSHGLPIYFRPFITLAFGILVGLTLYYFIIGAGKVRNQNLAIFFACTTSLLACYYSWAFWLDATVNSPGNSNQFFSANLNPIVMLTRLVDIHGTREIHLFNIQARGAFVTLIRIIEVAIIIGISITLTLRKALAPFSESQNTWANKIILPPCEYIELSWWLRSTLEDDDSSFLKSIKRATTDKKSHSIFTIYDCGENEYYLSINNRLIKSNERGKIKIEDDQFVKQISIDKSSFSFLLALETNFFETNSDHQTAWNMETI